MKVDDHTSRCKHINHGDPQGSILGPLFFIIYINDLLELFGGEGVQILLYADNTVIYYADDSVEVACREVEKALLIICTWCESNKLTINAKKTQHIIKSKPSTTYLVVEVLGFNKVDYLFENLLHYYIVLIPLCMCMVGL